MVRRIIWSTRADNAFLKILEFFIVRNGNRHFSRRLSNEIITVTKLLAIHPQLGQQSEYKNIRVIITGNYKIYYEAKTECIIIHMVWDCRQNPDKLKRYLNE